MVKKTKKPATNPTSSVSHNITAHLAELKQGTAEPNPELMSIIYAELRRIANARFRHERKAHTMQPTDVVHEAYLRLMQPGEVPWKNRTHFLAIASEVMRRVLVEHARARDAQKRGGGQVQVELEETALCEWPRGVDLLELDEALKRFAELDPRKSQMIQFRFFSGMTIDETAEALEISTATAKLDWKSAKAWLRNELGL